LDLAWNNPDDLKVWRGVIGHVVCFQQLIRISEVSELLGSNVLVAEGGIKFIDVKAKNHKGGYPHPLFFPVDRERRHCVGWFLVSYMAKFGIIVGDKSHFFACKVTGRKGAAQKALPCVKVTKDTMAKEGKLTIKSIGLDPSLYASHSAKRGGALAAAEAGLNDVEITQVGQWNSAEMAARYIAGSETFRNRSIDRFRT
jgi:hypothetical protein